MNKIILGLLLLIGFAANTQAAPKYQTENVFIITLDGLRWQELFQGAEHGLLFNDKYSHKQAPEKQDFWHESALKRRQRLMPFFWQTIAKQGVLAGNRAQQSHVNIRNNMAFSSPGYHEILTGYPDPTLTSNAQRWSDNVTLLEWAEQQPNFAGKVGAFGSWDTLKYVLNTNRATGVYSNFGSQLAQGALTQKELWLNALQQDLPSRWRTVRNDAFTHHYALEYIKRVKPKLLFVSYGETDDFAHDGEYDAYLSAAHRTDRMIAQLWQTVQADPHYRNKTTFIITTDHGRGSQPLETWRHHASAEAVKGYQKKLAHYGEQGIVGSEHIWLAVLGPDTPALGELAKQKAVWYQSQVAATAAQLLAIDYVGFAPKADNAIQALISKQ